MIPPRRPSGRKRRVVLPDEGADEPVQEAPPEDAGHARSDSSEPWWREADAGRPRPVTGGVAARTRRGPIGVSWWSRRFLESLEAMTAGGRVGRGRSYARRGQVVDLHVSPGVVSATVQGSRDDPYAVHLRMPVVPDTEWGRIVAALAARAGYAARMLAGELPHEVEEVFDAEGASLLPAPHARLVTECTCPDWENPCKHVAAVCFLLAEEFDRDPFSLLSWRGRGREEVLGDLRALRREHADSPAGRTTDARAVADGEDADRDAPAPTRAATDGDDEVTRFWSVGPELDRVRVRPEAAPVPGAVLRLVPRGTISVRGGDLADVLVPVYRELSESAAARARR